MCSSQQTARSCSGLADSARTSPSSRSDEETKTCDGGYIRICRTKRVIARSQTPGATNPCTAIDEASIKYASRSSARNTSSSAAPSGAGTLVTSRSTASGSAFRSVVPTAPANS